MESDASDDISVRGVPVDTYHTDFTGSRGIVLYRNGEPVATWQTPAQGLSLASQIASQAAMGIGTHYSAEGHLERLPERLRRVMLTQAAELWLSGAKEPRAVPCSENMRKGLHPLG